MASETMIDCSIADADGQIEVRIAGVEIVERRQDDGACYRAGHFDA